MFVVILGRIKKKTIWRTPLERSEKRFVFYCDERSFVGRDTQPILLSSSKWKMKCSLTSRQKSSSCFSCRFAMKSPRTKNIFYKKRLLHQNKIVYRESAKTDVPGRITGTSDDNRTVHRRFVGMQFKQSWNFLNTHRIFWSTSIATNNNEKKKNEAI